MNKQIRSARIFSIGFVGEAEVTEGSGDCQTLGIGTYGDTIAIIENHASPTLEMLRKEMESSPLGIVNIITLTGEAVTDKDEMAQLATMAGRQIDMALRGIFGVRYLDANESKVSVKVNRRGRQFVTEEPRYKMVVNREFYCLSCHNDGKKDCKRTVERDVMSEVTQNGRKVTLADCPECGNLMTRIGRIMARREMHGGLTERKLVFEPPTEAYCFSCKRNVRMIWMKAVRYNDEQPRPSYRGNCIRCLAMVGAPWQRTKMVPVKNATLEKLVSGAKVAEKALYEERIKTARKRHNRERSRNVRHEAQRFEQAMGDLKERFSVA